MLDNIAFFPSKTEKFTWLSTLKVGEGRTYFVSQLFCLGLKLRRYTANTSTLTYFVLRSEPLPEPWNTDLDSFQKLLALKCLRADKVTNAMQLRHSAACLNVVPNMCFVSLCKTYSFLFPCLQDFVSENLGQRFIEPQVSVTRQFSCLR